MPTGQLSDVLALVVVIVAIVNMMKLCDASFVRVLFHWVPFPWSIIGCHFKKIQLNRELRWNFGPKLGTVYFSLKCIK